VATASHDFTVKIWNLNGTEQSTLRGHERKVNNATFNPDGTRIITAASDNTARIWDLSGEQIGVLMHESEVNDAAVSPDGKLIATACRDKTARIWNFKGEQLEILRGHSLAVTNVAFSPTGAHIGTVSKDGVGLIYFTSIDDLADLANQRASRKLTPWEQKMFHFEE